MLSQDRHVAAEYPHSSPNEATVSVWESYAHQHNAIPLSVQEDLRQLLRSEKEGALSKRIILLLNPRRAHCVELTDVEFENEYYVTTENNFQAHSRSFDDMHAAFDVNHGYYVARRLPSLEEMQKWRNRSEGSETSE